MLVETLVLAILVSFAAGGRLKGLQELDMTVLWLPVLSVLLERGGAAAVNHIGFIQGLKDPFTMITELVAYAAISVFIYKNLHIAGMKFILLGTIMNFLVILVNGGYMPVDPQLGLKYGFTQSLAALEHGRIFAHEVVHDQTSLILLSDIIMIPPPWPFPKTISIGDVLIDIGAIFLIFKAMKSGHAKRNSV